MDGEELRMGVARGDCDLMFTLLFSDFPASITRLQSYFDLPF